MARGYNYNPYEAPVIEYIPGFDPTAFQMQAQQLQDVNKKWDETEQAVAEAIANYGSLPVRDLERPYVQKRIADFSKNVQNIVDQYGGRYDLAAKDIARKMANETPFYNQAKQAYEQQKQYEPLYAKYAQNLLFKGQDPRKQSIFDEQSNYIGTPDFTPYERTDYSKTFREDVGKLIDDMIYENKLSPADKKGYLETITKRGIAAIDNPELQRRLSAYVPDFVAKTTFGFDPELQQYKDQPLEFLNKLATYGTTGGMTRDITKDEDYWMRREADEWNRRFKAEHGEPEDINVWGMPAEEGAESDFLQGKSYRQSLDKPAWLSMGEPLYVSGNYNLTEAEIKKLETDAKNYRANLNKYKAQGYNPAGWESTAKKMEAEVERVKGLKESFDKNTEIFKSMHEGKAPKDYNELADWMDANMEKVVKRTTQTRPILHPVTADKLKTTIKGMTAANFRIGGVNMAGNALNDAAKELGTNAGDLRNLLSDPDVVPRYNRTTGEYYVTVPSKFKISSSGKVDDSGAKGYTRLYFTPDKITAEASTGLKQLKDAMSNDALVEVPIGGLIYRFNPEYKYDKSNLNSEIITIFAVDNFGNKVRLTDENNQPMSTSIKRLETTIEAINEANLKETYTKPYLKSK